MSTLDVLRGAGMATVFLTRIRLPTGAYAGRGAARWAIAWFPLVGGAIGAMLAAAWRALDALPAFPAAVLVIILSLLLTGALHEDGLADSADALGGATSRERIFEILKDSRIGSYGGLALVSSVMLRVSVLATMQRNVAIALVLSHALGRTSAAVIGGVLPYVTPPAASRSAPLLSGGRPPAFVAGFVMVAILAASTALSSVSLSHAAALLGVGVALTLLSGTYFVARVGGTTGDLLGAAEQIAECGVLVACALLFGGVSL